MKNPLKILMLEDSATDAELIQGVLIKEKWHCEFKLVMTEKDFLDALDQFQPHVILSDNTLPQFNASEALKIFNQRKMHIPFILVTGTVSEEFAAGIMKSGADDYILKDRLIRLPAAIDAALQKKKSEAAIEQNERVRKLIMESALDAVICVDTAGVITVWNPQAEKMFGWKEEEMIGKQLVEYIIPVQYRETHAKRFSQYFKSGLDKGINKVVEFTGLHHAGNEFPVELAIVPVKQTGGDFFCAFIRDITEKKRTEEALKTMEQEIVDHKIQEQKKITRAVIKAQEKERNHIGQELHDNVCQILAGAKLYLSSAEKKDTILKELLSYPIALLNSSINEIRLLTNKVVTPLKNIDLKELIQLLLNDLSQNTTIKTNFSCDILNDEIDDGLKLNVYRIIQEQIHNIVKHAEASEVYISIETNSNTLSIFVSDDGKGFDMNKKRKGIGISNITNRVETYNGKINIKTSPGNGCKILIEIPC